MEQSITREKRKTRIELVILGQLLACFFAGLILLVILPNSRNNYENALYIVSLTGVVTFAFSVYLYYKATGYLFSPYIMFYGSFFLFQFGQCFLKVFSANYDYYIFNRYDEQLVINGTIFSVFCVLIFNLGALVSLKRTRIRREETLSASKKIISLKSLGYLILSISIIPAFYYAIYDTILSVKYGYLGVYLYSSGRFFIFNFMQYLFVPSCMMLLVSLRYNSVQSKIIRLVTCIYAGILLIAGGRTEGIAILITLICFMYISNSKVNKESMIKLIVLLSIIIVLIPTFANFRRQEDKSLEGFIIQIGSSLSSNPIIETIGEMGYSISPLFMTMNIIPSDIDYKNGESYITSLISMVPSNLDPTGIARKYVEKASLDNWLMDYYGMNYGPGFSIIAESYYNFGYLGVFAIYIWGVIIGKILGYKDINELHENSMKLYIKLVGLYSLFTFPRRPTIFFVKQMVYLIVLVYIVNIVLYRFSRAYKKGSSNSLS